MINLRSYQQDVYDRLLSALDNSKSVCVASPTGSGKSVLIAKLAQDLPGRTLILTHRIEILQQNAEWLKDASILTARENTLKARGKITIAMVQTAFARIKKYDVKYLGHYDNIILDEVQILIFEKVFKQFDYTKLIGFTGTPVLNKKKYTTIDGVEYVEPHTLSEIFETLVQGVDSRKLIELGYLVEDYNITLRLPNFGNLKRSDSQPDGYTKESLNSVYSNTASLRILREAYITHCKGKKTLIFNSSTKINKIVYDNLLELGLNVKLFDTVNETEINPKTDKPYSREEIIEWFKSERDAVLINTNVFTTGFNVTDVEVIIVNRATTSLALWIQMVGRGSRTTDVIYKDKFTVIDLGQNIDEHGIWSIERDWEKFFRSPGRKRKHKADMFATWECGTCHALNVVGEIKCSECGADKTNAVVKKGRKKKLKDGMLEVVGEMPKPNAYSILKYCEAQNEDTNFAYSLLERKILDLFMHYKVSSEQYHRSKPAFAKRIMEIYRPIYFAIMRSKLKKGGRKKLETQLNRILTKLNKIYGE